MIVPLADPETLKRAGDKGCLAVFAATEGIPIPKTLVYDPATGLNGPLESLCFPVLVKPVDGTSGQGIRKLETPSDFTLFAGRTKTGRRWVVQEIIGGADVGCSVLCQQGRIVAWTMQRGLLSRSKAYMPPAVIDFIDDETVLAVIAKTMKALRFEGVANCDLRCDAATRDVRLIEINPRFWGSLYASHVAGVNFPALALAQTLGLPLPRQTGSRSCQFYFIAGWWSAFVRAPWHWRSYLPYLFRSDLGIRLTDPAPDLARIGAAVKRLTKKGSRQWRLGLWPSSPDLSPGDLH